jgi:hypothetical protein
MLSWSFSIFPSSTFRTFQLHFFQTFFKPPYVCTVHGVSNIGRGSFVVTTCGR